MATTKSFAALLLFLPIHWLLKQLRVIRRVRGYEDDELQKLFNSEAQENMIEVTMNSLND